MPILVPIVVENIVSRLIRYNDEKAAYARKDRTNTKWVIWDQTVVQTLAEGNEDKGTGICLDYADTIMETGLRAGIKPEDIAVVAMQLIPKTGDKTRPDRHAVSIVNTGDQILVLEQDRAYNAAFYFSSEKDGGSPQFEKKVLTVETLNAEGDYTDKRDEQKPDDPYAHIKGKITDHDGKIRMAIETRFTQLQNDLAAIGAQHEETATRQDQNDLPISFPLLSPCDEFPSYMVSNLPRPLGCSSSAFTPFTK